MVVNKDFEGDLRKNNVKNKCENTVVIKPRKNSGRT